jgi:hypothetical protein
VKNLVTLVSREDVHDFVGNLWQSHFFKKSYAEKGFIFEQVERFAWLPRFFAETTNDHLERAHFATWWNVITLRQYDNPVISDLYYLHEITHAATMPYLGGIGRAAFDEKMQRNELEASVLSEIAVYFELPGLREAAFGHEIYADKYLEEDFWRSLWRANKQVALEAIRTERRHIMTSKPEHEMSKAEVWIRRFAEQNEAYSITWADKFRYIEGRMWNFQHAALKAGRGAAARHHESWLRDQAALDPVDNIPFRAQAEMFAPFYWSNKEKFAAEMGG